DAWKVTRTMVIWSGVVLLIASLFWLQSKFDGADRKNALGIVQTYHSKSGTSIPEVIAEKHPGQSPAWSGETQASCTQAPRVRADVGATIYVFVVDINTLGIHPGNKEGEGILGELDKARPAGSAAPSASAPASAASGSAAP